MRAIVYEGPRSVAVEDVPDARIEAPNDAFVHVRVGPAGVGGRDADDGRIAVREGKVLGHENMGMVQEVGPGVTRIKVGDRVSVPFNIACGSCCNCTGGWTYGYANTGPYDGGQAELLRVPYADFNLLELPAGTGHENDFAMLSDVFPTGFHGTELAEVGGGRPR
jgi:glutathione-independent formaldehyde dehydrogenase